MELNQQVCSLDLAKRLKELGVKQESFFFWYQDNLRTGDEPLGRGHVYNAGENFSAFTVAELGEMLPWMLEHKGHKHVLYIETLDGAFAVKYLSWGRPDDHAVHVMPGWTCELTEADARAAMLIYLLENKFITL